MTSKDSEGRIVWYFAAVFDSTPILVESRGAFEGAIQVEYRGTESTNNCKVLQSDLVVFTAVRGSGDGGGAQLYSIESEELLGLPVYDSG